MQSNLQTAVDVIVRNASVASAREGNTITGTGTVTAGTAGTVSVGNERSVNAGSERSENVGSARTETARIGSVRTESSSNVIVNATAAMSKSKSILLQHHMWLILVQWSLPWILSQKLCGKALSKLPFSSSEIN
jgi:hypothetical protein